MILRALLLAALLAPGTASIAGATAWDPDQIELPSFGLNSTLGASSRPADRGPDGRIHLAFMSDAGTEGFQIGYSVRQNDGAWDDPIQISEDGHDSRNPTVAVDQDGRVHVAWEDFTPDVDGDIRHRVREPDGTWGEPAVVSPAPGVSNEPGIAVDAFHHVHLVWVDGRSGQREILHTSRGPGEDWGPIASLSPGGVVPQDPSLSADGLGKLHVAWADRGTSIPTRQSFDIVYVRLDPQGGPPPAPVRLVDHVGVAQRPFVEAADDGTIHLVWLDNQASVGGLVFEVFYKRYLPGIGWGHTKRFTYDETGHGRPMIVLGSGNTLNVAWEDYRTGNPEIFYRQITRERGWDRDLTQLTTDVSSSQAPTILPLPGDRLILIWTDAQGSGSFRIFAREGEALARP